MGRRIRKGKGIKITVFGKMIEQSPGLVVLAFLGAASFIPVLVKIINVGWNFLYELLSLKNLSIRAIGEISHSDIHNVMTKMAFVGKDDVIIDEVFVYSKLRYQRRIEGPLAWMQVVVGYLRDDVEGLSNVLGKSIESYLWIFIFPFHRIKRPYIRKPLSILWGLVILYYFLMCLLPPLWPVLFSGPYYALSMLSENGKVKLSKKGSKMELARPFILKSGSEEYFRICYELSEPCYQTIFGQKVFVEHAEVSYVKAASKLRIIRLPDKNEFTWKVNDNLRVKIRGKMRRYHVKLGESYMNINFKI